MSSSTTSDGLRWRDDLPDRWDDVAPWPPLPAGRSLEDGADVELVELRDGAAIQANESGRFVWAQADDDVVAIEEAV